MICSRCRIIFKEQLRIENRKGYKRIEAKRVPYGVSDFLRVIRENQYYVDKTMYIPLLEAQPDNLIFIRPRRFGKSLFLSMLEAYYDCKLKDQFQEIFGGLWIGAGSLPLYRESIKY